MQELSFPLLVIFNLPFAPGIEEINSSYGGANNSQSNSCANTNEHCYIVIALI
jgi:hypothetical protein